MELLDHAEPRADRRGRGRGALFVLAVAAVLVLPPLGQRTINTSDEARFPLLARDMLERGVLFDAYVREKQYRNKPPLYPWMIALLSLPRGRVTEATAHAPVALAAIGAVLFTFLLGDRLWNATIGLWAGLALATSYGFFAHSQKLLPDMLVVCFAAAAGYAFWRAMAEPARPGLLVAFYAALALGVFAKGPLGLLPLPTVAIWLWSEHGVRGLGRLWSPAGVVVFAVVTAGWAVPFLALGSGSFMESVFWRDWLDQYVGVPVPGRLVNLVADATVGLLPWTLVVPLALVGAVRGWSDPRVRFALVSFAVPLVAIALSENPRTRYLVAVYPGAVLLVAWWAGRHGAARTAAGRAFGWGALIVAVGAIVALPALSGSRTWEQHFVPVWSWTSLPLLAGVGVVGLAFWQGFRLGRPGVLVYGVSVSTMVILAWGNGLYNGWVNETQDFKRLARSVARHAPDGEARVFGGRFFPIDFYLERDLRRIWTVEEFNEYVAQSTQPIVVVNGRTWGLIQGQISPRVRVLESLRVRSQEMLIVSLHDRTSDRPPRSVTSRGD